MAEYFCRDRSSAGSSRRILTPNPPTMRSLRAGLCVVLSLWAVGPPAISDAQTDATLYMVSYLEATGASKDRVRNLLAQFAEASRKEGATSFEVLQRTTDPNQFLMLEVWKDQQALDAHASSPHARQFREQVDPLLIAPIDERLCVATMTAPPGGARAAVYVVTHIDVPGTSRDAAMQLMRQLIAVTRNSRGNVRFDVVHQKARTNHFTAIAAWADQQSLEAYQSAPQTKMFRRELTPLLGALYDDRWYRPF